MADYSLQFTDYNMLSSVGGFVFGASPLIFAFVVIKAIRGSAKASDRVWDGASGLEWTLSSPPLPYHSFETPPVLDRPASAQARSGS